MGPGTRDPAGSLPVVRTHHDCCDSEPERISGKEAGLGWRPAPEDGAPGRGRGGEMVTTVLRGSHLLPHLVVLLSIQPEMCCRHLLKKDLGWGCGGGKIPAGLWLSSV